MRERKRGEGERKQVKEIKREGGGREGGRGRERERLITFTERD